MPDKFTRIRIEGDGTSVGTRITDVNTGSSILGVTSYTVKHTAGGRATAIIEFQDVKVDLECDAVVSDVKE